MVFGSYELCERDRAGMLKGMRSVLIGVASILALSACFQSHARSVSDSGVARDASAVDAAAGEDASVECPIPIPRDGTACFHENPHHGRPRCTYMTSACGTTRATCSGGHWGVSPCALR